MFSHTNNCPCDALEGKSYLFGGWFGARHVAKLPDCHNAAEGKASEVTDWA